MNQKFVFIDIFNSYLCMSQKIETDLGYLCINGFMQDSNISSALGLEILQSCTKP